ncbi:peptide ABC transporter permease [Thermocladium modestius]|uniref:Peptide ABC transporter permease n=1 Tax=Thermocladium modestius TaxID=62609 RepID=A0A830GWR7_9CREN|nr:ABC transporter permease [Thermocladium modestius]GGP21225.1 peptide ABC transporter permease [Thermocladium modestius]
MTQKEEKRGSGFRILGMSPSEISREFFSSNTGKVASALFIVLVVVSIYSYFALPPNFGAIWNNPSYWKFNPDNAPPAWINYFTSQKLAPQTTVNPLESVTTYHGVTYISSTFSIENPYSVPWQDIYLVLNGIPKNSSAAVQLTIYRPDGSSISIGPLQFSGSYIDLASSPQVENQILSFFSSKGETITLAPTQSPIPLLFQTVNNGKIHPLDGNYTVKILVTVFGSVAGSSKDPNFITVIMRGNVYGLMGTDFEGHDLWEGLLAGFPIDLEIGIVSAVITMVIAIVVGIMSGYFRGWIDEVLTRITDIVITMPAFPLLIVFSVLFAWSLWDAILFLSILSWGGAARIIRSMIMQIREAQYIEGAKIVGARGSWILRNHILPQIMPYSLYLLVTSAPGAILTISALNFLNLAGSAYPTWGNLLYWADSTGALYAGMWWWVIPPGLLIAFVAVVFILVAIASEPVVNPRLRYG